MHPEHAVPRGSTMIPSDPRHMSNLSILTGRMYAYLVNKPECNILSI